MVDFYYQKGEPAANYIESHPWLKPSIRVILYPLVAFAWFMISTTTFYKLVIGICLLTGSIAVVSKVRLRKKIES
jgi:hypothetical protein